MASIWVGELLCGLSRTVGNPTIFLLSCTGWSRVTELPYQFPYEGLVHPISLDLCAAKSVYQWMNCHDI